MLFATPSSHTPAQFRFSISFFFEDLSNRIAVLELQSEDLSNGIAVLELQSEDLSNRIAVLELQSALR